MALGYLRTSLLDGMRKGFGDRMLHLINNAQTGKLHLGREQ